MSDFDDHVFWRKACDLVVQVERFDHAPGCSEEVEDGCNCGLATAVDALYEWVGASPGVGEVPERHPLQRARLAADGRKLAPRRIAGATFNIRSSK